MNRLNFVCTKEKIQSIKNVMQETHFLESPVPLKNKSACTKGSCMRPGDIVAYMAGNINII